VLLLEGLFLVFAEIFRLGLAGLAATELSGAVGALRNNRDSIFLREGPDEKSPKLVV